MPRERTDSALRKARRTKEQKADLRRLSACLATKRYRRKNKEVCNESAKERMRRNRAVEKDVGLDVQQKERRKLTAQKYYLKVYIDLLIMDIRNREKILRQAERKRVQAHVKKHGGAEWAYFTYPYRKTAVCT
ncbi:hypothetical protein F5880DRAFT_1511541 [Lentinula raphanica]|nr:hypothetical protein F5880DRAFT_1511541 [Lentinula raphanica]